MREGCCHVTKCRRGRALAALCALLMLTGCAVGERPLATAVPEQTPGVVLSPAQEGKPQIPKKLELNEDGEPLLDVYDVKRSQVVSMPIEEYVCGVLAGEMRGDWPLEALKAQAILARTFVLKFIQEKESRYPGADISTDIEEAQAYEPAAVNERIEQAVEETRGLVLSSGGELSYAWFHAHSGGRTALAEEGLDYKGGEPPYTRSVAGMESDEADEEAAQWEASFSAAQVLKAAQKTGASGNQLTEISVAERGDSGRATRLSVNGKAVSAAAFRIALGSTEMRSTLIDSITFSDGRVVISGRGYGHGVGMSQWGAYAMAQDGEQAQDIVLHYFQNVEIVPLW